jgi:hypothetical protein
VLVVVRRYTPEIEAEVRAQCEALGQRHLVTLSPQVATPGELGRLEAAFDPYWLHVVGHGVTLYGKAPADLSRRRDEEERDEEEDWAAGWPETDEEGEET